MELIEAYEILGVTAQTPLIDVKNSYEEAMKQVPRTTDEFKVKRKKITQAYETILINQEMDREFDKLFKYPPKRIDTSPIQRETYKRFIFSLITILVVLNLIPYIGGWVSGLQGVTTSQMWHSFGNVNSEKEFSNLKNTDYNLGYKDGMYAAFDLSKDVTFSVSEFNLSELEHWFYIEEEQLWTVIIPLKIETTNLEKVLINAQQFKLGDQSPVTDIKENIHLNEKLNTIYYLTSYDTVVPIDTTFGLVFTAAPFEDKEERLLTYDNGLGQIQEISLLKYNEKGEDDSWKLNLQFVDVMTHEGWY